MMFSDSDLQLIFYALCAFFSLLAIAIYGIDRSPELFDMISPLIPFQIFPDARKHGGDLVVSVLKAHGITHIFTLIGGHISPIIVAAQNAGLRIIDTRHEATSVFAADAFARLSGTVGVAVVTAGPGVTNTITAVKNAQMAESPVLLLGGAAATILKGRGSLQDIDQLSLFKSLCKYTASVKYVRHIIPVIRKAMQVAQSGTPGPVFVELPLDVLYPYDVVSKAVNGKKEAKGFWAKIANLYLRWYLHNLHSNAFMPRDTFPLPVTVPLAKDSQVEQCKNLLIKAKKPIILLGSQALLPASSASSLQKALNTLGIPCFLSGMARGLLGRKNPLLIRQKRKEALKDADLVILAGTVCDFRLSYGRNLNRNSKIVAINMSKAQLFKNSDVFWKPAMAVNGNVSDFIIRLAALVQKYSCNKHWLTVLQKRDMEKEEENRKKANEVSETHLNPLTVLFNLEDMLNENTILITDGGDFVATASYILRPRGPLKWLDPGPFGTLGVGAGFALGAKLCQPDSDVFILYGDGSLGYSLIEFDTFVRHKLPIVGLVGNDACWTQIEREQVPMFQSDVACKLKLTDYHAAVESLGGKGFVIGKNDKKELKNTFKTALEMARNGESVLINAHIGKSDFRSGSISI